MYSSCAEKFVVLQCAYGYSHRHSRVYKSYFGFVYRSFEYEVVHVGNGGDCSTIVHRVTHYDRISDLYRDVENNSVDSGTYESCAVSAV